MCLRLQFQRNTLLSCTNIKCLSFSFTSKRTSFLTLIKIERKRFYFEVRYDIMLEYYIA